MRPRSGVWGEEEPSPFVLKVIDRLKGYPGLVDASTRTPRARSDSSVTNPRKERKVARRGSPARRAGLLAELAAGFIPREGGVPGARALAAPAPLCKVPSGQRAPFLVARRLPWVRSSLHPPLPVLLGGPRILEASLAGSWEYPLEHLQINFNRAANPKNQSRFIICEREPMLLGKRKQVGMAPLGDICHH